MAKPRIGAVQDQLIGTVARQKREEIRVTVRKVGNTRWLDLRIYYEAETGDMRPSQRGVSLSPKEWIGLRKILQQLKDGKPEAATPSLP
jgi:Transcriptional Coactivator p15 (PC4)